MLTLYRRHKKDCSHRDKGRTYRRCNCPVWVDGTFERIDIRKALHVRTWEDADRELDLLKKRLTEREPTRGPVLLSVAWDEFVRDATARGLKERSLNKYRYLRKSMEAFAACQGLRYVFEFDLEQLRKWRATRPYRNLSALKKLELVRCFLRFSYD